MSFLVSVGVQWNLAVDGAVEESQGHSLDHGQGHEGQEDAGKVDDRVTPSAQLHEIHVQRVQLPLLRDHHTHVEPLVAVAPQVELPWWIKVGVF